jgi:hypothetical protein
VREMEDVMYRVPWKWIAGACTFSQSSMAWVDPECRDDDAMTCHALTTHVNGGNENGSHARTEASGTSKVARQIPRATKRACSEDPYVQA